MYPQFGPEPTMLPGPPPLPPTAPTPPPPAPRARPRRTAMLAVGITAVAVAATVVGVEVAQHNGATVGGTGSVAAGSSSGGSGSGGSSSGGSGSGGSSSGGSGSGGYGPGGSSGSGGYGSGGYGGYGSTPQQDSQASATAAQQVGIVDIDTVLGYQSAAAAGTGMILTSTGEILTNNHVVDGATSIKVTVVSTGATYRATVVGTDPTGDVAVIQLKNAGGLQTAKLADSNTVKVGDAVTGVGNAGGVGGVPSAAKGSVKALGQTIKASDDNGGNPETLHGMIETDAPIEAGDSGGPLYNSAGRIVGMDTAASTAASTAGSTPLGGATTTQPASTAFAIPIDTAESIAARIEAGRSSGTIHLGYPAFLGVTILATSAGTGSPGGATINSVLPGSAAGTAGIVAGDVVTAVGGRTVASGNGLKTVLANYRPGQQVKLAWTGIDGQSHSATVTLATGPAD